MAGPFDFLQNPKFKQFISEAGQDLGYGLTQGNDFGQALGIATQRTQEMQPQRDAYALMQEDKAKQAEALNQTTEWLRANGKDALYAAVQSGAMAPAQAWQIALEEDAGARSGVKPIEINGQLVDPTTGAVLGDYRDANAGQPAAPSGYQWTPEGALSAIPGGPASRGAGPVPMNSTIQKELFEADDALQAGQAVIAGLDRALELNPQAWDGPFADQRSGGAALFGNQDAVATQELKNVVTSQALESLKAVFGGMPTEGERKILLEIQGSVDQPKAVREAIYTRAKAAAERRIAENARKAAALRSGQYFDSGYSAQTPTAPNTTSTGLSWSIEP